MEGHMRVVCGHITAAKIQFFLNCKNYFFPLFRPSYVSDRFIHPKQGIFTQNPRRSFPCFFLACSLPAPYPLPTCSLLAPYLLPTFSLLRARSRSPRVRTANFFFAHTKNLLSLHVKSSAEMPCIAMAYNMIYKNTRAKIL